jgi:hypothetical protein
MADRATSRALRPELDLLDAHSLHPIPVLAFALALSFSPGSVG